MKKWQQVKYNLWLQTDEWKEFRKNILDRDNHICFNCGTKGNTVHHICYYDYFIPPWLYNGDDVITVCEQCHKLIHKHIDDKYNGHIIINIPQDAKERYLEHLQDRYKKEWNENTYVCKNTSNTNTNEFDIDNISFDDDDEDDIYLKF